MQAKRISIRRNLGSRKENKGGREGDTWDQSARHGGSRKNIQNERKVKAQRQNTDEEKQVKVRYKSKWDKLKIRLSIHNL